MKIKAIKSAIMGIHVRLDSMMFFANGLKIEELAFFNTDIQHIFDSLLDIDNETHFFDGLYKYYAEYLSNEIKMRSRGIRYTHEEEARVILNKLEHWNE